MILDNFAASMREQELDITESDFEFFKYAFRDLTCDAKPEALAFHNALWSLLASVGEEGGKDDAGQPFDAEGRPIESPLSPLVHAEWELPQQAMFRMAVNKFRPTEGERDRTDNVRGFLKELYEAEASPLTDAKEPGISFQEYWGALLETPAVFQTFTPHRMSRAEAGWDKTSCLADGSPMPFVEMADAEVDGLRGWEATRLRILELSSTVELRSGEGGGSGSTGQWDRIQEALLQEPRVLKPAPAILPTVASAQAVWLPAYFCWTARSYSLPLDEPNLSPVHITWSTPALTNSLRCCGWPLPVWPPANHHDSFCCCSKRTTSAGCVRTAASVVAVGTSASSSRCTRLLCGAPIICSAVRGI